MITCGVTPWPSEGGCGFRGAESEFMIDADENGDEQALCGICFYYTPLESAEWREGGELYEATGGGEGVYG